MHIYPVQNKDNRAQNNIMAISTGICAGTAGAIAGSTYAPRAAKNLDELLNANSDVFYKTIDNMQNTKSLDAVSKSWGLIPARAVLDNLEVRINNAFPGDKISSAEFKQQLIKQEKDAKNANKKIDAFINYLTNKKGQNISLEEYFNEIKKRDILPENIINIVKKDIVDAIGEDGYKAPNQINDTTIDMFKSSRDIAINVTNKELELYKNLSKIEKNGFLHKKDMLESAKKEIKPVIDNMLHDFSFDSVKKFVPQTGKTKWALITGGAAAIISAACVKLFGNKNS